MRKTRHLAAGGVVLAFTLAAVAVTTGPARAAPPKKAIDVDAERMVKQMTDYLAGLQSFTLRTSVADEVSLKSGEKIALMSNAEVAVQRPNRLRSLQRGGAAGLGIWYDGTHMTVACKSSDAYETLAAPPTLDAAIDQMRKQFDIDAPGADLLYARPYDILMEQVVSGRFIGHETIDGMPANHVAFRGEQIDWQLWIKDGSQPLPLRYVITTKDAPGHPAFAVQMSDWNTQPTLPPATFDFQAPATAKPAKSVADACAPSI
ncbi:MAG TPA: DUF2092 domain-containing protein [Polyangia bacterium]|nr:DUF2092 domain-containing protein [Polyangia bacterium]